jgi:hypothetical protein
MAPVSYEHHDLTAQPFRLLFREVVHFNRAFIVIVESNFFVGFEDLKSDVAGHLNCSSILSSALLILSKRSTLCSKHQYGDHAVPAGQGHPSTSHDRPSPGSGLLTRAPQ